MTPAAYKNERLALARRARHFDRLAEKWPAGKCQEAARNTARKMRARITESHIREQSEIHVLPGGRIECAATALFKERKNNDL
jgi:hypothetical protein